jgi:hypothetical protein
MNSSGGAALTWTFLASSYDRPFEDTTPWYPPAVLLRIRTPATNDRGPLHAEHAFAAIRQANARRLPLRLVFGTHAGSVGLFIVGPSILRAPVESQFYANYPDCTLDEVPTDALDVPGEHATAHADLFLLRSARPMSHLRMFIAAVRRFERRSV